MNALDSLRLMVASYPGGRPVVAARINKNEEVLRKELSGTSTHKLGVEDACLIAEICAEARSPNAMAYANAVCTHSGGGLLELPVIDDLGCAPTEHAALLKETSDVVSAWAKGMADKTFSDNDLKHFEREALELMGQVQRVIVIARAQHMADKVNAMRGLS